MKEDLDDTKTSLAEDKQFLADLEKNCKTKEAEWTERCKTRAEEILAIHETIKILNDDDALELFKKTLPSASLLQLETSSKELKQEALAVIKAAGKGRGGALAMIAAALSGKKVNFEKVIKMIDEMVGTLKREQVDDADKKEYCEVQFDTTEDKIKETENSIEDLTAKIADTEEGIKSLTEEIAALKDGIFALDKSVVEATEQRKEENAEYTDLMASDSAAKELLRFAKNRLNKFYNPKLYKAPPKRVLTDEDRATLAAGGTLAPTQGPTGGIAGTGITVLADVSAHAAPPPPPETAAAFSKKSEESNGVIAMIDLMIGDLTKEMTEAKATEKNAQEDYESAMKDAAEKRATDNKSLADKQKAKAQTEADLEANK